jgi:hypothetical protein
MSFILHAWHLLSVTLASWGNQQQQQVIDFQRTESEVLKENPGKKGYRSVTASAGWQ